jgi:hypothetical protein
LASRGQRPAEGPPTSSRAPHAADGGNSWDDAGAPLHRHPERAGGGGAAWSESKDPVASRSIYLVDTSCRDVGSRRRGILRLRLSGCAGKTSLRMTLRGSSGTIFQVTGVRGARCIRDGGRGESGNSWVIAMVGGAGWVLAGVLPDRDLNERGIAWDRSPFSREIFQIGYARGA